ncbi:MAG: GNAT family N-acetyltransferase [Bacillota bacterium]|nr:GNAT family N-acetyltransferase [Bacillota bacterium]MDW7677887.1 GNAT family N-acetyltransferase [Bacillota bacterium]
MKIQYSKPEKNDAELIFDLFQQLKRDSHEVTFAEVENPQEIINWLETDSNSFYIARYNQQVIGVLRAVKGKEKTAHACQITIAVSSEYRQQGIAKSLVQYGLSDLKNQGILIARAFVFSDNKPSLNTLLSVGFTITGSIAKHHYNHQKELYADDIVMHKELV